MSDNSSPNEENIFLDDNDLNSPSTQEQEAAEQEAAEQEVENSAENEDERILEFSEDEQDAPEKYLATHTLGDESSDADPPPESPPESIDKTIEESLESDETDLEQSSQHVEAQAMPIDNQAPEETTFIGSKAFWFFIALLVSAFVLRLLLTNVIHGHPTDINNFKGWSIHAAKNPMRLFYKGVAPEGQGIWCDYPPLYIYFLWGIGKFYQFLDPSFQFWNQGLFTTLIKLPPILADIGCVALVVLILKRYVHIYLALMAGAFIAFHPAVIFESAMWGQVDSLTFGLQLLSIWFILKQRLDLALIVTALNILVKPQGLILLPLIVFLGVYKNWQPFVVINIASLLIVALSRLLHYPQLMYVIVILWAYLCIKYFQQYKQLVIGGIASFATAFALSWPFVPLNQIFSWLVKQYTSQGDLYSYSSIQAFNIWAYGGHWKSDTTRAIFDLWTAPLSSPNTVAPVLLQHKTWGLILFALAYAYSLYYFYKKSKNAKDQKESEIALWHTCAIVCIAFFLFPTRMHERYLYSGLLFLAGSVALNMRLLWPYLALSGTFLLNLFYELPGTKLELKFPNVFYSVNNALKANVNMTTDWMIPELGMKVIITLNLLLFAYICYRMMRDPLQNEAQKYINMIKKGINSLQKSSTTQKTAELQTEIMKPNRLDIFDVYWLIGLLFIATIPKLYRLGFPAEQVFDEVYHARAGGEYVIGLHPFEWVHPPIAKLLIAVGVWFYELTAIGWRIMPVIAGVLLIAVVYLLGRFILPYRWQAILAAFLLTCDGVYFVQSRTAMTNIFATLFQVASLTFLWRYLQYDRHRPGDKNNYWYLLGCSIFISIALATRWTSVLSFVFVLCVLFTSKILPGVDVRQFVLQLQLRFIPHPVSTRFLALFPVFVIVIPAVIYLLSYTQYISLGHNVNDVIEMQKGIYNYHKGLDQPHPYYSAWYTWPWLTRPTWYYFQNNGDQTVGGILALGNPAIWWVSIPLCLIIVILALTQKKIKPLVSLFSLYLYVFTLGSVTTNLKFRSLFL